MRVAFWRTRLLPGSETFIRTQEDALREHGDEVFTFGFALTPSPMSRDSDLLPYRSYNAGRAMLKVFERTRSSARLRQLIGAVRPDVIHAHFATDAGLIAPIARSLSTPLVVSAYGYDITRALGGSSSERRQSAFRLDALKSAAAVTANSDFLYSRLLELGVPRERVSVVRLGVPLQRELSAPVRPRSGVLFVGRFTEKKGLPDLIEAMSRLEGPLAGTPLTVIGDGSDRVRMEELARINGVDARFLGARAHSEVKAAIEDAAVLAVPSKVASDGDSEGLPTIILEASAAGIPVVATRHSGIPEAVVDGETGLLVDEGDVESLASALSTVIGDPVRAKRLGDQGRLFVRDKFDQRGWAARIHEVYEGVINDA